jgi:hypothetical protein
MNFKCLLLAGLSLLCYAAVGQVSPPQVYPTNYYNGRICAETQTRMPVQIYGNFNDNNQFFIELVSYVDRNKQLGKYEAVLENGNLVFTVGNEITEAFDRINFRIVTTSPATQTGLYENSWFNRGEISIASQSGYSDTLNTGMTFTFNVNVSGNNPITVTLNDSSTRQIAPSPYYQQTISLVASEPAEFFIVKAVNACNVPVPFSGKVKTTINPISIVPLRINDQNAVCEGSDIELSYAVSGGTIPESATYRLRLFNPYSDVNAREIYDVPARKIRNGVLAARMPQNFLKYETSFQIAVLVDNPALVSSYLQPVTIYKKPVASFRSQSESATIGQPFSMWFDVSGPEPYTIELNNGNSYTLDQNRNITVYPVKTETFSISSLRTACGVTTDLPKQTVVATLPASIAINAPADQQWDVCENQKLRLPFITNAVLTANTKFTVEGRTYNGTTYEFEAKIVNDSIEFQIPHSPAEWSAEGYFNIRSFRIKTSSPSLTSLYRSGFNVRGMPRVSYWSYSPRTMNGPQYFEYALNVSGGIPYTVTDIKGETMSADYGQLAQFIYVPATGVYGPLSVTNGCYTNNDPEKMTLIVNPLTGPEPAIVVHPPTQKYFCSPDSIEVSFETFGKFEEGNEFQITADYSPTTFLTVTKPGRYKIATSGLAVDGYARIQVKSTRPAIQAGAGLRVILEKKPIVLYPGELGGSTPEKPRIFAMDQKPYIYTQLNSYSPYTAEYTDGVKDYHFKQVLQYDAFFPEVPKSKVMAYTLKSLSNSCGTTEVNQTVYLYWTGYNLSMKYFPSDKRFCTGEEIVVPFNIEKGSPPAGTTYHLQIGKTFDNFTTVASKTTPGEFRYVIPESMEGEYHVRIMTDGINETGSKRFFVNKTPTATISLNDPWYAEIDYGQSAYIDYNLTGGGPWEMILNGRGNLTATEPKYTQTYTVTNSTVFQLQSVSNQCGFGSVSGSASVRVRPRIVTFQPEHTSVCSGETIRVKYQIGGDIPTGEKVGFYLRNSNGKRFELPSVNATAGTVSIPIPTIYPGGWYELICHITGSDISESRELSIHQTPDLQLTGTTTINKGDFTYLLIRATNGGNIPLDLTFSDGTKHNYTPWGTNASDYLMITPANTTTYSITSATGSCGTARASGIATVTVNPPSARTVRITGFNILNPFCEKDTLSVYYTTTGTFSAGNQFTVQFYDSQGKLANSVTATGKESPLRILIPASFSTTEFYRIRLAASDANTASSDYQQIMLFGTKPTASFASDHATLDDKGNAKAVVLLTGTGPWRYNYGNDFGAIYRYTDVTPDTLAITSKEPHAYFKLLSVSNGCGTGTINEPSTIRVEIILGTEPAQTAEPVTFGPNPTNGQLKLHFQTPAKRQLTLFNMSGIPIWTKTISETDAEVDMRMYPSGSYLMKIGSSKGEQSLRIVKQ